MESKVFYVIEKGKRLPNGTRIRKEVITQEEIDEMREDGESDEDVINCILNDIIDEAEQQFCSAIVLTDEEFNKMQNKK